ncbi:MAG: four helix bundle protein [Verrucomicrobiae bacterium]|nr:four helix bundle protein [Verrucomicrobiae bacterium]
MQDFQNLRVWQRAHELSISVYRATERFPQEERFGLSMQIRRAVVSIGSNLAEGCGRDGDAEFARFVRIAMGSAFEVHSQLLLARDLGYIDVEPSVCLVNELNEVKRMMNSLLTKLKP